MRIVVPLVCVITLAGLAPSQVLLSDNFNNNRLDPTKWRVVRPFNNSGVFERNQHIELVNRGYLRTAAQYDPVALGGIRVTGTWRVASAPCHDYFDVLTRSDAVPVGRFGNTRHGLEFHANTETNQCFITTRSSLVTVGKATQTGTVSFRRGGTYAFDIIDAVTWARITMRDLATRATWTLTASILSDNTTFQHIVFHNRERVCGTNIAHLDDVVISQIGTGTYTVFRASCSSSVGTPRLFANAPRIGQVFNLLVTGLKPSTPGVMYFSLNAQRWQGRRLPIDLGVIGAPGCFVNVDISGPSFALRSDARGVARFMPIPVPIDPRVFDYTFYNQYQSLEGPANRTLKITTTNAGKGVVGT